MFKLFTNFINTFHNYFNKTYPNIDIEKQILYRSMKLTEEIGEFNEQLFSHLGKGNKKFSKKDIENEFADVIIGACMVAKSCDIDIQKALQNKIKILEKRYNNFNF